MAVRLLIYGSCVSRDALNYAMPGTWHLVDYYARSSLGSLASPVFTRQVDLNLLKSSFQERMVRRDHTKEFIKAIGKLEYDILLFDLIDERFNVHIGPQGGATISNEMRAIDPNLAQSPGRLYTSGTPEFLELWKDGWRLFVKMLRESNRLDCLRVNEVFWSEKTISGFDFSKTYSLEKIISSNAMLNSMYKVIGQDVSEECFLRFNRQTLQGADHHRWGKSPFHYVDGYYYELLRRLGIDAR